MKEIQSKIDRQRQVEQFASCGGGGLCARERARADGLFRTVGASASPFFVFEEPVESARRVDSRRDVLEQLGPLLARSRKREVKPIICGHSGWGPELEVSDR